MLLCDYAAMRLYCDATSLVLTPSSSAVALAVTAPAESALEFAREEHTAGPFVHTPAYCYDPDDPNFGFDEFDDQTCLGGGDWGLGRLRRRQRRLGSCCVVVPDRDVSGNACLGDTRSVFGWRSALPGR